MAQPYSDRFWKSPDGLDLHYRDYSPGSGEGEGRPPVICMHGLTRNARDFEELAEDLSQDGWRVLVPEMRGRGLSEYAKDSASYNPLTYVTDVEALLADQAIERFIAIGTSLGGLMTMLLAAAKPGRLAAAVLNDIGPQLELSGIERIAGYVGQGRSFPTWMHAARDLKEVHGSSFPKFGIEEWLKMAKRTLVVGQNGRIGFDYDMAIADPFKQGGDNAAPPDLWPAFATLKGTPSLLLKGELSDLVSHATVDKMAGTHGDLEVVTVPQVGHAPTLDEPIVRDAITRLLERI